jgi:hypothetical protein
MSNHIGNSTATGDELRMLRSPQRYRRAEDLLSATDSELAAVDPVLMNLLVAKGIPSLRDLDISRYQAMADEWADEIRGYLPAGDANFYRTPERFRNDLRFARLALMCWYVGARLDIRYREDPKYVTTILYTDPGDLFLHGVMDSRLGTCGNMSTVYVALAWRLGWPVSLACVGSHSICRYDDGEIHYNIEATTNDWGRFSSHSDEHYLREDKLPEKAIRCGSDLRSVTPREMLGLFFGNRAHYFNNTLRHDEAEGDYLLARYLFPKNRNLHIYQHQASVQYGIDLFEPWEKGHPIELAYWLEHLIRRAPWNHQPFPESFNATVIDALFRPPDPE